MKNNDPIKKRIDEIMLKNKELTLNDFNYQLNVNNFNNYYFDVPINKDGIELLKHAIKELNFSENDINIFEKILIGIMAVEGVSIAEPCHVAESIQYVNPMVKNL